MKVEAEIVEILLESISSTMATLRATAMGAASIPATHQMPAIDNLARSLDGRALQQYNIDIVF